jgi:hypothetical protein
MHTAVKPLNSLLSVIDRGRAMPSTKVERTRWADKLKPAALFPAINDSVLLFS